MSKITDAELIEPSRKIEFKEVADEFSKATKATAENLKNIMTAAIIGVATIDRKSVEEVLSNVPGAASRVSNFLQGAACWLMDSIVNSVKDASDAIMSENIFPPPTFSDLYV